MRRSQLLITFWVILSVLPWLFAPPQAFDRLIWLTINFPSAEISRFITFAVMSSLAEILILLLIAALVRRLIAPLTRFIRMFALSLLGAIFASYFFLQVGSWYFHSIRGAFLGASDFGVLRLSFDWQFLLHMASGSERALLIGALALGALFAVTLLRTASKHASFRSIGVRAGEVAAVLLVCAVIAHWGPADARRARQWSTILSSLLSPASAAIAQLVARQDPLYVPVPLERVSASPLNEYLKSASPKEPVNVVFIIVEALRADELAAFGGDPRTMPNVNALAAQGILFRRAYTTAPETVYAVSAIMSGLYPLKFPTRDSYLDLSYPHVKIDEILKGLGYRTGIFSYEWQNAHVIAQSPSLDVFSDPAYPEKSFVSPDFADAIHFAKASSIPGAIDAQNVALLSKWLERVATRGERFFASLYLYGSHTPYDLPPDEEALFLPAALPRSVSFFHWTPDLVPIMKNRYRNTLHSVDRRISSLLVQLRATKSPTVVFVTGDHGDLFAEHDLVAHGGKLYEGAVHVPLIIVGLNTERFVPTERDDLVSHVDIAPTVLDLIGAPPHPTHQGHSLLRNTEVPRPAFMTVQTLTDEDGVIALPYKYTRESRGLEERLFDVVADPDETKDLCASTPGIAARLRDQLANFRNTQLTYYAQPPSLRDRYNPPSVSSRPPTVSSRVE